MSSTAPSAAPNAAENTIDPRRDSPMQMAQAIATVEFPRGLKKLRGLLHGYRAGAWRPFDNQALADIVVPHLGAHAKPSLVKSIIQALYWLAPEVSDLTPSSRYVCFDNCVYDISTQQQVGHNPAFNSRNRIPVPFDLNVQYPKLLNIVRHLLGGDPDTEDKTKRLQEIIGLVLFNRACSKIFVLLGDEGSGVRLIAELLYLLAGEANTTVFGLNQFHLPDVCAAVEGKLLNLTFEFPTRRLNGDSKLGQIVAGNRIEVSPKGGQSFRFTPRVKIVVVTPSLPLMVGTDDELVRQLAPLVFTRAIPAGQLDSYLEDLISEMSGLVNWGLQGLHRFIEQGHLTEPSSSKAILQAYREEADPFRLFVDECLRHSENRPGLYGNEILHVYAAWAKQNGHKIKENTITLGRKLASLGYTSYKSGTTFWEVCWAEEAEQYGYDAAAADNDECDGDDQVDVDPQEQEASQIVQELPRSQPVARTPSNDATAS